MKKAIPIELSADERRNLEQWTRSHTIEKRLSMRAQIILLASEGKESKDIALKVGTREATITKWRNRFIANRIIGLQDEPRPGKPHEYTSEDEKRILGVLDKKPPKGYGSWSGGLIAEHLKDISKDYVWRVLNKHGIELQRRHSWCVSTDPEFSKKAADIVALYLNPPDNAIVLS